MAVSNLPMAEDTELAASPLTRAAAPRRSSWGRRHWAMNVIGIGGILALCYYGEAVLAVILISTLLAFVLAPVVDFMTLLRLPRGVAAFIAIAFLMAGLMGTVYYSYNQA